MCLDNFNMEIYHQSYENEQLSNYVADHQDPSHMLPAALNFPLHSQPTEGQHQCTAIPETACAIDPTILYNHVNDAYINYPTNLCPLYSGPGMDYMVFTSCERFRL